MRSEFSLDRTRGQDQSAEYGRASSASGSAGIRPVQKADKLEAYPTLRAETQPNDSKILVETPGSSDLRCPRITREVLLANIIAHPVIAGDEV